MALEAFIIIVSRERKLVHILRNKYTFINLGIYDKLIQKCLLNLLISHIINMSVFKLKRVFFSLKLYGVGVKKNVTSVPRDKCLKIPQEK